jgi:hypothetical protein
MKSLQNFQSDLKQHLESKEFAGCENARTAEIAVWYDSGNICALADAERHLGHAVNTGRGWIAFDSTHSSLDSSGFLMVGHFKSAMMAKLAIESSVGAKGKWFELGTHSTH